jgi:TPR repeat protein
MRTDFRISSLVPIAQDFAKAREWCEKAAAKDDANAREELWTKVGDGMKG